MKKTIILAALFYSFILGSCSTLKITETTVGAGWANNSVNTVIFRNSALTSYNGYQFTAYYDDDANVVVAKRKLEDKNWQVVTTPYKGNVKDAHNDISITIDSKGYLHMAWDHHDSPLRYVVSSTPMALTFSSIKPMTGLQEEKVTYPEFHNLPDGKLLFAYRSGKSGRGNLVMNLYNPITKVWAQIQNNLLDGEGNRSAYWQMCVGKNGLYLSWVWRETWDVSTNHDICYAFSADDGKTWKKTNGESYSLPINEKSAEIVWPVSQDSSLINQTSITTDGNGNPYIASYWKTKGIPQYKVVYYDGSKWDMIDTNFNTNAFTLKGGGTKSIPISRPEIFVHKNVVYLLFRDAGRNNRITLAYADIGNIIWKLKDILNESAGQWEPNFDKELWASQQRLNIFFQNVSQTDGEGLNDIAPTPVKIIELNKLLKI